MNDIFSKFSRKTSNIIGSPPAFIVAIYILVLWAISGPFLGFSDTWQLVINTGTTIVTFLIVFLIQNTQNRDAKAMHTKLDALILATKNASSKLIDVEDEGDDVLEQDKEEILKRRDTKAKKKQSN